jgi:hypothetical protein
MKKLIAKITKDDDVLLLIKNTISIAFGSLDRGDISETTNWGCFSNTGEIVFIDSEKEFEGIYSNNDNIKVKIYYSSDQTEKLLATFLIDDFDYEGESGKVKIILKDSLMDWQQQDVGEYYEFVEGSIYSIWQSKYGSLSNCSTKAKEIMSNTTVPTRYMENSSRWNNANKICQATMLRCFCDNDGTPLFSSESPKQQNSIVINPQNILSIGNRIKQAKTKVDSVSIYEKNIVKHAGEPIQNPVQFNWYNATFSTYEGMYGAVIANWLNYNVNCETSRYHIKASVETEIEKPKHFYELIGVNIDVNKSIREQKTTNIIKVPLSTITIPYETKKYSDGDDFAEYEETDKKIYVSYDRENSIPVINNPPGGISAGDYCISDGKITVLGNFFTEDGETIVGDSEDANVNLSSNELIQSNGYYYESNIAEYIVNEVKNRYGNGVECLELEVTPSEYYGINGESVINKNKPLFEKYDLVIPFVMRNGKTEAYSKDENGSPKTFKVMGIEYSYGGLLRQKLYLQEAVSFFD